MTGGGEWELWWLVTKEMSADAEPVTCDLWVAAPMWNEYYATQQHRRWVLIILLLLWTFPLLIPQSMSADRIISWQVRKWRRRNGRENISAIRLLLSSDGLQPFYYFHFCISFLFFLLLLLPHRSMSTVTVVIPFDCCSCHNIMTRKWTVAKRRFQRRASAPTTGCGFVDICGFSGKYTRTFCKCGSAQQRLVTQANDKGPTPIPIPSSDPIFLFSVRRRVHTELCSFISKQVSMVLFSSGKYLCIWWDDIIVILA